MTGRYRVLWRQKVTEVHLAGFVVQAMEREESVDDISAAVRAIDRALAANPLGVGESRGDYERVFVANPLTVRYEVFEEEAIVLVVALNYHPRPSDNA